MWTRYIAFQIVVKKQILQIKSVGKYTKTNY